ncbi:MAG: hypothetical protein MUO76_11700 [Anaerolineaceae bacterium]|nr:hypothetical protein [Anaerolineaceae bacterium]
MSCKSEKYHNNDCSCHDHHNECKCGCRSGNFGPEFWTKAEKITFLEEKLEDLRSAAKNIEERIAALKADG